MELTNIPENPAPANADAGSFESFDGTQIRYAIWKPQNETDKGTICLFHGRTEYIEKYYEVITELLERGYTVATMDWRGQGGSARLLDNPRKGHVEKFEDYLADADHFIKNIVEKQCPRPYCGMAHSMGGNLLFRMCATANTPFDRAILCSPMLGLAKETAPLPLPALKFLGNIISLFSGTKGYFPGGSDKHWDRRPFESNMITSDQKRYERSEATITANPALGIADSTVGWIIAACNSMMLIAKKQTISKVSIPMLILASGNDRIVSTETTKQIAHQVKTATLKVIPDAEHELMMENDNIRKQFWEAFDSFEVEYQQATAEA